MLDCIHVLILPEVSSIRDSREEVCMHITGVGRQTGVTINDLASVFIAARGLGGFRMLAQESGLEATVLHKILCLDRVKLNGGP